MLGEPGELAREPWFGRDAIRTAATWAGSADSASEAMLTPLRRTRTALALAAGRRADRSARGTIDAWFETAAAETSAIHRRRRADLCVCCCATRSPRPPSAARRGRARLGSRPFAEGGGPGPRSAGPRDLPPSAPARPDVGPRRGRPRSRSTVERHQTAAPRIYFEDLYAERRRSVGLRPRAPTSETSTTTRGRARGAGAGSPARFEFGCSIGVLTERLAGAATSCWRSTCPSAPWPAPVNAWRAATPSRSSAARCRRRLPDGPFDLIVCSEVLYYFDAELLDGRSTSSGPRWCPAAACSPCTGARRPGLSAARRRGP